MIVAKNGKILEKGVNKVLKQKFMIVAKNRKMKNPWYPSFSFFWFVQRGE